LFNEGKTFTDKELREAFAQIAEDRAYSLRDYFTKARFSQPEKSRLRRNRYTEALPRDYSAEGRVLAQPAFFRLD